MKRHRIAPRPDWKDKAAEVGFTYYEHSGWDESVAYAFTLGQVEVIEAASAELHARCLDAVDHVCANPHLLGYFDIAPDYQGYVLDSWRRRDPYVMGRFDLAYDPNNLDLQAPKLLEYNADTPTMVIETALMQWFWLQDKYPGHDQYNSLHEKLIEQYREVGSRMPPGSTLHFSSLHGVEQPSPDTFWSPEEYQHTMYYMDLARQAGLNAKFCAITDVGWDGGAHLIDLDNQPIQFWSKLYPWEWLAHESFGAALPKDGMGVVEPVWKMLLSNKAILPILWELFPGHPNLLPAYFEPGRLGAHYVGKPTLAREGANIEYQDGGVSSTTGGSYEGGRMVYQKLAPLPVFDGQRALVCAWVVGGQPAGMILREDKELIMVSGSKIIPHYIDG